MCRDQIVIVRINRQVVKPLSRGPGKSNSATSKSWSGCPSSEFDANAKIAAVTVNRSLFSTDAASVFIDFGMLTSVEHIIAYENECRLNETRIVMGPAVHTARDNSTCISGAHGINSLASDAAVPAQPTIDAAVFGSPRAVFVKSTEDAKPAGAALSRTVTLMTTRNYEDRRWSIFEEFSLM